MLGYPYQTSVVLFGSKSGTNRTAVTLTAAYSGNRKVIPTGGMSKLNMNILYTTGAAETNNSINILVEASPDGTNFYQIPNESVSGGTSTLTQREFTFVGASAATAYALSLPIDLQDEFLRVSINESGVASVFGTAYIEATISGAK